MNSATVKNRQMALRDKRKIYLHLIKYLGGGGLAAQENNNQGLNTQLNSPIYI